MNSLMLVLFGFVASGASAPEGATLLVKLSHSVPAGKAGGELETTSREAVDHVLRGCEVRRVFPEPPRGFRDPQAARAAGLDRWIEVRAEQGVLNRVERALAQLDGVEDVEFEGQCEWFDTVPNDRDFNRQWALQNEFLGGPKVWDAVTATSVVVAVLDSGADIDHVDLAANVWINPGEIPNNGLDDDGNGLIDDVNGWDFHGNDNNPNDNVGHGTHTSGIVGAVGNNERFVTGVMWDIPVMTIKIGDFGIQWSNAARGITYAADMGAQVLSMSWGDQVRIDVVEAALDYAVSLDVLPVAAAGNFGNTRKTWPASYDHTMAIISTNDRDRKSGFSTYGDWCDMAAPGEDILSLAPRDRTEVASGTSMSCPFVAGVAGVIRDRNPRLDRVDTRYVLNASAHDLGDAGFDARHGWGRLDMAAAVAMATRLRLSKTLASPGERVQVELESPQTPGAMYLLLVTRFGREPGLPLSILDPGDFRTLPLNYDPFLFALVFSGQSFGIFHGFSGFFDGQGRAQGEVDIPAGGLFLGLDLSMSWVSFDPANLDQVLAVSGSQNLSVR